MLEKAAGQYDGKIAVVAGDQRLSYSDLDKASNKLANALLQMGTNKGDRVALLLPNRPEFVIAFFGIIKIGAIAVPLDPQYHVDELTSLFQDCQPKVLLAESHVLAELAPVFYRSRSVRHVIELDSEGKERYHSYRDIITDGSVSGVTGKIDPEDTAVIMYTSSPSFHPTGVMLSHQCLVAEAAISGDGFQQTDKDVVMLFALPMFHVMGLVSVLLGSVCKGSMVVMVPGTGLSIGSLMEAIERERGTMWLGVPYIFALAAEMAEKQGVSSNLGSLRLCGSAGAPLPVSTIHKFKQHYRLQIADFWGLTEATCYVTGSPVDGSGRIGSVGKALSGWEVKIVDDKGVELPVCQAGEMLVKGPFMQGYYNNSQVTGRVIKDGWLHTGDIGRVDEDGNLFITGREKATIIVKGQNIHPGDVESVLHTHPKVAEAVVMGIPDELRGEIIGAFVVLKEGEVVTEQEIRQFCLGHLAAYRAPKQVIFLDSLPRTTSGEIDQESIREHFSIPPVFQGAEIS